MAGKTPHYKLTKPVIGGDESIWGSALNANFDAIDATLKTNEDNTAGNTAAILEVRDVVDSLVDVFYYVGIVIGDVSGVNPETRFPGTRWVPYAAGCAPVGVGAADGESWAVRQQKGAAQHTLAQNEMPAHAHLQGNQSGTTDVKGKHVHAVNESAGRDFNNNPQEVKGRRLGYGGADAPTGEFSNNMYEAGEHNHFVTVGGGATDVRGGGQPHNNIQPSIGTYFWERVE